MESSEVEPWKRVRIVCGGEDVLVHLGKKDAGSPFDRIFARIEDVTGGELVTYGLASYRESDSYAYLVLHERSWDAVRDALGDCFDEFFVGDRQCLHGDRRPFPSSPFGGRRRLHDVEPQQFL